MATVTGLTAQRMLQIEKASIVSGRVDGDDLILRSHDGTEIVAGRVRGPAGFAGPTGTNFWVTETALNTDVTSFVMPTAVPGQTARVGDTIMSTNPASVGSFGTITSVTTQEDVTVSYLGSLRGPAGDDAVGGGGGGGDVEPGTMVWREDYDASRQYKYGDVVRTGDGLFVALDSVVGQSPALPMNPFADSFDRSSIGSEWQFNEDWFVANGKARQTTKRNSSSRLIKTNLTPDGSLRVDDVTAVINDSVYLYCGWIDDLNHYRILYGTAHAVSIVRVVNGVGTTLASGQKIASSWPQMVLTKHGGTITIQFSGFTLTATDPNPLNGSGWGFGYANYHGVNGTANGSVGSVLFTPSESPLWSVIERRWALDSLTNVQVPNPEDRSALIYDSAIGTWRPEVLPLLLSDLDSLTDVETSLVEDGDVLGFHDETQTWRPVKVTPSSGGGSSSTFPYGGALIVPDTNNQPYSVLSTYDNVRFQTSVYDTNGFWTNSAPNRLTIPSGVTKIRLTASVLYAGGGASISNNIFRFAKNGGGNPEAGLPASTVPTGSYNNTGVTLTSAVIDVVPGDYFELQYFTASSFSLSGNRGGTYFSVEVVERSTANVGINARVKDLTDVNVSQLPQAGDTLLWDPTTNRWVSGVPVVNVNAAMGLNKPFRGAMAVLVASRSLTTPTFPVPWDNTLYDTDALWSASTPGRFTIPSGVSMVRLSTTMKPTTTSLGTGNDTVAFRKNGEGFPGDATAGRKIGFADIGISTVSPAIRVVEGDFFEVRYNNSSASNIAWSTDCYFAIEILEVREEL